MREILFRGKPVHKEDYTLNENVKCSVGYFKCGFAYGSLIVIDDTYFICTGVAGISISLINNTTATLVEVDPKTVGQYAGLTDKNGKKIFEGDILHCTARLDSANMVVVYEDAEFRLVPCDRYKSYTTGMGYKYFGSLITKVIGNIHDNPELLEVQE